MQHLSKDDPELAELISNEESRIENTLDLIAAENHAPRSIMEALGSIFNTKTVEGYPGKRFHAGCVHADQVENLAVVFLGLSILMFSLTAELQRTWRSIFPCLMLETESWQ